MAARSGAVTGTADPSGIAGAGRRLSLAELHRVPAAFRPAIDPRQRRVRIVHLGIGAFHRAHQAWYTEECGDWGSCGVTQRSPRVAEQLAPQDDLYTLLVRDGTESLSADRQTSIQKPAFRSLGNCGRLRFPKACLYSWSHTQSDALWSRRPRKIRLLPSATEKL